jgi:putative Mn2+ efflux pump MntP
MNCLSTVLLAFAMSTDAFAAAIGKGATLHKPRLSEALRTGLIFGLIEAITPVIGWALGLAAAQYIVAWDHWIAFALLAGMGLLMVRNGLRPAPEDSNPKPNRHSFWLLVVTAVATSIDAMAVGVGLAFIEVNIVATAVAIGLATMLMVTTGMMLGRILSKMAGRRVEMLGGTTLILIGTFILYQHLT